MTRPVAKPTLLALALASSFPALAQTAPDAGATMEVVVTAQKRATLASKTPLALSVLAGDELKSEGALDTRRLADLVPNLQLGNGALGAVEVAIRGIGSTNATEVGDPAVGLSIDGIYLGRPQMAGAALYDVERVEVLRGPQGTLYGRNANAGAINIITRKPSAKLGGSVSMGLSNYSGLQADGMINVPVSEALAMRAVVSVVKRDGYIDTAHAPANNFSRDRSDVDNTSARLHGLVKFGKDHSLLLTADYSDSVGAGPGSVDPAVVAAHPTGVEGRYVPNARYEGMFRDRQNGLSAEYKVGTAVGDLTVLAGHRAEDRGIVYSVASAPAGGYNYTKFTNDSVEARLASSGSGPLQYVLGLYGFNEKGSPIALGVFAGSPNALSAFFFQDPMTTRSKAAFGQLGFAVTEGLRVTGGVRMTKDEKARQGCTYTLASLTAAGLSAYTNPDALPSGAPPASSMPACPAAASVNDASVSYNNTTYRVGAEWDASRNDFVFASMATGFKAGGFNDGTSATRGDALTYKPETITAAELGWKGRYMGGKAQLSATAFHYDYSDLQVTAVTTCPTGTCSVTQNAAKAKVNGVELESRWQLTAADRLNFGATWTDAKYTRFAAAVTTANPAGIDWSGHQLDKAPKSTLSLGYTHQWLLPGDASLSAYLGTRYSSKYLVSNPALPLHIEQTSFHKSDAHLTYASADDRWDLQAYVRNIEDRNVVTSYQRSSGTNSVYLAEPRMIGIRGNVRF